MRPGATASQADITGDGDLPARVIATNVSLYRICEIKISL